MWEPRAGGQPTTAVLRKVAWAHGHPALLPDCQTKTDLSGCGGDRTPGKYMGRYYPARCSSRLRAPSQSRCHLDPRQLRHQPGPRYAAFVNLRLLIGEMGSAGECGGLVYACAKCLPPPQQVLGEGSAATTNSVTETMALPGTPLRARQRPLSPKDS